MKHVFHQLDSAVTKWITVGISSHLRPVFLAITSLGDPISISIITIGLIAYGFYDSNMQLALSGAVIPATVIIGAILKMIFERARPMTEYAMNMKLQTFSFPSGHSSGSTITYGLLAHLAFVTPAIPWGIFIGSILALLPIAVGISRVYLGAHFPTDVIAGWALGLVSLLLVVNIVRPML